MTCCATRKSFGAVCFQPSGIFVQDIIFSSIVREESHLVSVLEEEEQHEAKASTRTSNMANLW